MKETSSTYKGRREFLWNEFAPLIDRMEKRGIEPTSLSFDEVLSPSQHQEQIFKQILTGCGSVVNGLASLRNAFGDAHGKGIRQVKPSKRHAELAVNLSGTISAFLISTHQKKS